MSVTRLGGSSHRCRGRHPTGAFGFGSRPGEKSECFFKVDRYFWVHWQSPRGDVLMGFTRCFLALPEKRLVQFKCWNQVPEEVFFIVGLTWQHKVLFMLDVDFSNFLLFLLSYLIRFERFYWFSDPCGRVRLSVTKLEPIIDILRSFTDATPWQSKAMCKHAQDTHIIARTHACMHEPNRAPNYRV